MKNKLQQDIIKISGKTIFINPFLYWRRFDKNTNRWLRKSGQISHTQIISNRYRFYPELEWEQLTIEELQIKDGTVELFLKTLNLISIFHSELNSEQLLEVEKRLCINKKLAFEKWVKKSFVKQARLESKELINIQRRKFFNDWKEWFLLKQTQNVLLPVFVIICLSALVGWYAGIAKNSCNPYFESRINNQI